MRKLGNGQVAMETVGEISENTFPINVQTNCYQNSYTLALAPVGPGFAHSLISYFVIWIDSEHYKARGDISK